MQNPQTRLGTWQLRATVMRVPGLALIFPQENFSVSSTIQFDYHVIPYM